MKILILQGLNYKFTYTDQFDLKDSNDEIKLANFLDGSYYRNLRRNWKNYFKEMVHRINQF